MAPVCGECEASSAEGFNLCLNHLRPADLDLYFSRLAPGATVDARGVTFTEELLERLLEAVQEDGHRRFKIARFQEATFEGYAIFTGAVFAEYAFFDHARFTKACEFDAVQIGKEASFINAEFGGTVSAAAVRLDGTISFENAKFVKRAFIAVVGGEEINLNRARFSSGVDVRAHAERVTYRFARFEAGATLRLHGSAVDASDALFGKASSITGAKLNTLRRTDVSNLILADVDLTGCQ